MGDETGNRIFQLTIGGQTRDVEVRDVRGNGERYDSLLPIGAYQKNGGKVWPGKVIFWRQQDGSYRHSLVETFLNRSGYRLIAWADQIGSSASNHNSAHSVQGLSV